MQTARANNQKSRAANKALDEDLTDIGRAGKGIKLAFNYLNDGTIRPVATKGTTSIPSLADNPLPRRPGTNASAGPVFNVPRAAKEPLPLQLGTLDSAGMAVVPQEVGTGERTRIFDAFSPAEGLEFNRFVPTLWAMESAYPLMEVEEVRFALPADVPAFPIIATPLDIRVRLRFPLAESASAASLKAKPKTASTASKAAQ